MIFQVNFNLNISVYHLYMGDFFFLMGVSKNRGKNPPKWMVNIMENPIKIDDLGGFPIFLETPKCWRSTMPPSQPNQPDPPKLTLLWLAGHHISSRPPRVQMLGFEPVWTPKSGAIATNSEDKWKYSKWDTVVRGLEIRATSNFT